jgi:hypothetical protein
MIVRILWVVCDEHGRPLKREDGFGSFLVYDNEVTAKEQAKLRAAIVVKYGPVWFLDHDEPLPEGGNWPKREAKR